MSYRPDPGGVFASDTHRRVLGHLPVPGDDPMPVQGPAGPKAHSKVLGIRVSADPQHELASVDDLEEVLRDLEADGHASESKAGWRMTKAGLEAIQAPAPEESSGRPGPALLEGLEVNGRGDARG